MPTCRRSRCPADRNNRKPVAALGDAGLAESDAPGVATISAEYTHQSTGDVFNAATSITVLELDKHPDVLEIRPATASMPKQTELQLRLFGIWNPGTPEEFEQELTTQDETSWKSDKKDRANVNNDDQKGLVKAKNKTGDVDIEAKYEGEKVVAVITVTN